ncbi:MAG: hypothetical protein IRZ29_05370 [Thermoflavifilum sp.]|nr:hypothetical protein [Thermoflavifilum sp.]
MRGSPHYGWLFLLCMLPVGVHAAEQPGLKQRAAHPVPCEEMTIEKLMLMYPGFTPAMPACEKSNSLPATVLRFYSWYMKLSQQAKHIPHQGKEQPDLLPPFDVQWSEIEQYVEYLKHRYPELDTLHFSMGKVSVPDCMS